MPARIGFGYDVHRLVENRKLILGGITIPFNKGCLAHSDGDVLIHSIIDALLGAAAKRDIGYHFPDTSEEYRNIESSLLLTKTREIIEEAGYRISNIDCTVSLEEPKIKDYIPLMTEKISKILFLAEDQVNIKAGTNEKMGFIGTGEGIAAYSVVLLENNSILL
jgi:2-C-methyl-D-erythritol 2,4-cyclodiphosphate synthase